MKEIKILDLDSNFIKLDISEYFYKFGKAEITIKADNYNVTGVLGLLVERSLSNVTQTLQPGFAGLETTCAVH